jgi:hypothetical protein
MRGCLLLGAICVSFCRALPVQAGSLPLGGESSLAFRAAAGETSQDLVRRYLAAARIQKAALRGAQMEVDIDARLPNLQKESYLRAVRYMSCNGQVTYQILQSSGDGVLKREVIARYLTAETDAHVSDSAAITPANYEFRLKAIPGVEQRVYILQLKPRKTRPGLFKGELWVDTVTGMPLRESGQFVKNPSMLLKRIRFVRDYEIRDGVSIPKRIQSGIETRFAGRAELSVRVHDFTYQESAECDGREANHQLIDAGACGSIEVTGC